MILIFCNNFALVVDMIVFFLQEWQEKHEFLDYEVNDALSWEMFGL